MSNSTPELNLTARWERSTPTANRWQALQAQLSGMTATTASTWTRRSSVICKWRALPAGVSAHALSRMG
jgi:hypothetical protein